MNDDFKSSLVLAGLAVVFLGLAHAFRAEVWGRYEPAPLLPLVDPQFTNTATVRQSAAELIRTGGDTSGLDCYACHDRKKPVQVHFDGEQNLVLPEEHNDLTVRHGRNYRNVHCFNCHDPENLDTLVTRDGTKLKLEESTRLCASCHGPTYRDWEIGIHGRTSGFWLPERGPRQRQDCASCHDPHSPAFPSLKPAPGPRTGPYEIQPPPAAASSHDKSNSP